MLYIIQRLRCWFQRSLQIVAAHVLNSRLRLAGDGAGHNFKLIGDARHACQHIAVDITSATILYTSLIMQASIYASSINYVTFVPSSCICVWNFNSFSSSPPSLTALALARALRAFCFAHTILGLQDIFSIFLFVFASLSNFYLSIASSRVGTPSSATHALYRTQASAQ